MSTKKILIIVGAALAGITFIVGFIGGAMMEPVKKTERIDTVQAEVQAEQQPETTPCTPLYAYVISKGVVEQAARNPESITFPLFDDEKVQQDGNWFVVDADFIRDDKRWPYKVSLRCAGGTWEVGSVEVNGAPAYAGANL